MEEGEDGEKEKGKLVTTGNARQQTYGQREERAFCKLFAIRKKQIWEQMICEVKGYGRIQGETRMEQRRAVETIKLHKLHLASWCQEWNAQKVEEGSEKDRLGEKGDR